MVRFEVGDHYEVRYVNRRTLLKGVAVGGIVPAAHVGTASVENDTATASDDGGAVDDGASTADTDDAPVSVRIVEIPETISSGALLEWTVEVENPTDRTVRPTVEYFVDGESAGNVTLTIEPGETERPFPASYRTEPVAQDENVTVRVEANGDSDERTVTLLGVDELNEGLRFPERDPSVQPGTTVHFEVGAVGPDATQTTTWWVDGENVGDTLTDPWQGVYYAEQNAQFWQETFETEGTVDVVAGVEVDGEQYRASWTVTVTPDGLVDPSIDAARPAAGILEVDPDETTTLEIDVTDPDGNLDRVVWWLSQADVILGESTVTGTTDTASLTVDGGLCHTCQIIPWVITADGTFTSDVVWMVDDLDTDAEVPDIGDGEPGSGPDADEPDEMDDGTPGKKTDKSGDGHTTTKSTDSTADSTCSR